MNLNAKETAFLTALAREQNQSGCRGPAHELLRQHAYPDEPRSGRGSIAFAYDAVPLIGMVLKDFTDLQELDDFLRQGDLHTQPEWPWASADDYRARLEEARREWMSQRHAEEQTPQEKGRMLSK